MLSDWFEPFYMPHGHCYMWRPLVVWLQVGSNSVIALSYLVISAWLVALVVRIRNLPFRQIFLSFGLFIVSCGLTHAFDIATVWKPIYWSDSVVRVFTAMVSLMAAVQLMPLLPQAVALVKGARVAEQRGIALETMLRDLQGEYDRTASDLLQVAERLQVRLGLELHDDLGQLLTGVAMLASAQVSSPEAGQLERVVGLANQAASKVRNLSRVLSPLYADQHSLRDLLQEQVDSMQALFPITCRLHYETAVDARAPARLQVYRIVQEAITNAVRHGRAQAIHVEVLTEGPNMRVSVFDDGSGMPEPLVVGLGIRSMRYRARLLGGSLDMGRLGRRTFVSCVWPNSVDGALEGSRAHTDKP